MNMPSHTLTVVYVLGASDFTPHNKSVIQNLARNGHQVVVVYDRVSMSFDETVFRKTIGPFPNVRYETGIRSPRIYNRIVGILRALIDYHLYLGRTDQSAYYTERAGAALADQILTAVKLIPRLVAPLKKPVYRLVQSRLVKALIRSEIAAGLARSTLQAIPAPSGIVAWLSGVKASVVVASPANFLAPRNHEVNYLRAAQQLKIPTAVMVLSWDNLSTKGSFHVQPDVMCVWHHIHYQEARTIHRIPEEKLIISGSPFYDEWFESENILLSRSDYLPRLGFGPADDYLLYLGSSENIAKDERWLVEEVAQTIRSHPDPRVARMRLLVRPHPFNKDLLLKLDDADVKVWRATDEYLADAFFVDYYNMVHHAAAVFAVNTSATINAVILDKPCLTILTDTYRDTQTDAVHFKRWAETGILSVLKNTDELASELQLILDRKEDPAQQARRQFLEEYIRPHGTDVSPGTLVARVVEDIAKGKPSTVIKAELADMEPVTAHEAPLSTPA